MTDVAWMERALEQARLAAAAGEVPVGAVVVSGDTMLAEDHNRTLERNDPTAHAEILVLRSAAAAAGNYRLTGARLYVTLEPCPMCAGALIWSRIARLVFGAPDPKGGGVCSKVRILEPGLLNHDVEVVSGVLEEESRRLLQEFFEARRQ